VARLTGVDTMLSLTPETIGAYLHGRGIRAMRTTPLTGGVSAAVFRVETSGGRFVVKQSCPQLRTRDAWFSDTGRVFREVEVMQALAEVLPEDILPRVLWVDRENCAFAMSHAPDGPGTWKEEMLSGVFDESRAKQAGQVLGRIHEFSAAHPERFAAFHDATVFTQLRVDPFYRTVARRCPDVADAIEPLIHDLLHRRVALCHGDFTPKNMLIHDGGFTLVDYETATFGEPAFDLGLFLAHLVLKGIARPDHCGAVDLAIAQFMMGYEAEVTTLAIADQLTRGLLHLGACLLSRTDGTSLVDYLRHEEQKNGARRLARTLLRGGSWDDVRMA
jgi:5-methylthioribose kinase